MDLYARIKSDVINLKPDVISVLIGVNDTWHEFGSQNGVSVPKYETIYRMFLEEVTAALPGVQWVLCEPFVLERTGLTVADHQRITIERYDDLISCDTGGVPIMPVLQGYEPCQYVDHVLAYSDRLTPGIRRRRYRPV